MTTRTTSGTGRPAMSRAAIGKAAVEMREAEGSGAADRGSPGMLRMTCSAPLARARNRASPAWSGDSMNGAEIPARAAMPVSAQVFQASESAGSPWAARQRAKLSSAALAAV